MKTKNPKSIVVPLFAAVAALLLMGGCASVEKANTESLLISAGFRVRTPETPKQKEIYASLEPSKVMRATVEGKGVFYVYKDAEKGVAYVGREAEYQQYRNLAVQQQVAQDYYMYAEMNRQSAYGWYGAWGPRGLWW